MTLKEFNRLCESKTLLLDGAMGSNLRLAGMPAGVCSELWAMEHPDVVFSLLRAYVVAGSDVIYAPTFSANRIGLAMHGLEDRLTEINTALVQIAKQAAGGRALVAGDVTTTGRILEPRGDMSYSELFDVYSEQISVLAGAGADLIAVETMMALDETMVALEAARSVCDLPVMCTLTPEADGNLLYGGTVTDAVEALQEMGAAAVGVNCSVGPNQLESVIGAIRNIARVPVIAKPNAGMPVIDEHGVARYDMPAEEFARAMGRLVLRGADIVGGCCGTNPEYIRLLAAVLS